MFALQWIKSLLESVLLYGGIIVAATMALLYRYQEKLLYHPVIPGAARKPQDNPRGYRSPAEYDIDFDDIYCRTSDGVLIHTWLLKQSDSKTRPTILFFHGNAGNIGFRLPNAVAMFKHTDCNIAMLDYRGYGNSIGKPSEQGLILDAHAILNHLLKRNDVDPRHIFVFGRSLGGAVALSLADQASEKIRAIIVENTFLNIDAMVDHLLPYLKSIKKLVLWMKWDNSEVISRLRHPILFIAGERDELVPHFHMLKLYDNASRSSLRRWHPVKSGTHNDTWLRGGAEYLQELVKFITSCSQTSSHETN